MASGKFNDILEIVNIGASNMTNISVGKDLKHRVKTEMFSNLLESC